MFTKKLTISDLPESLKMIPEVLRMDPTQKSEIELINVGYKNRTEYYIKFYISGTDYGRDRALSIVSHSHFYSFGTNDTPDAIQFIFKVDSNELSDELKED